MADLENIKPGDLNTVQITDKIEDLLQDLRTEALSGNNYKAKYFHVQLVNLVREMRVRLEYWEAKHDSDRNDRA
jgi:hypothetical protein